MLVYSVYVSIGILTNAFYGHACFYSEPALPCRMAVREGVVLSSTRPAISTCVSHWFYCIIPVRFCFEMLKKHCCNSTVNHVTPSFIKQHRQVQNTFSVAIVTAILLGYKSRHEGSRVLPDSQYEILLRRTSMRNYSLEFYCYTALWFNHTTKNSNSSW